MADGLSLDIEKLGESSKAGGDWLGAAASAVDSIVTNITNASISKKNRELQEATNAQNEALMRESWMRDDTAVQRRVKDLKDAGLSPLLAAGSAAGNSGPIQLNAPQNHFQMTNPGFLSALQAMQSIKGAALDNKLKELSAKYFGFPDWMTGILRIVNESSEDNPLRQALTKILGYFGVDFSKPSSSSSPSSPSSPSSSGGVGKKANLKHFPVAYEYTPGPVPTRVIKDAMDSGLLGYDGHSVVHEDSARYVSWVKQLMSTYGLSRKAVEDQIKNYVVSRWHKLYFDYDRYGSRGAVGFGNSGGSGRAW